MLFLFLWDLTVRGNYECRLDWERLHLQSALDENFSSRRNSFLLFNRMTQRRVANLLFEIYLRMMDYRGMWSTVRWSRFRFFSLRSQGSYSYHHFSIVILNGTTDLKLIASSLSKLLFWFGSEMVSFRIQVKPTVYNFEFRFSVLENCGPPTTGCRFLYRRITHS